MTTRFPRTVVLALGLALACAAPSAAQVTAEADPLDSMPIRFGPLGLSPTLAITDVGYDSNVYRDNARPAHDFTATIVPRLQARIHTGPLLLSASNATGFVYFQELTGERNVNYASDARADLSLARAQPFIGASLTDTRERLNAELDIRAPRQQTSVNAGTRLLLASRTSLSLEARRSRLEFDEGISFDGVPLSRTLNARTDTVDAGVLLALTPLTTFGLTTTWQRDRFDQDPTRDANSFSVTPSLRFDPTALIQGTVALGYRQFEPLGPELPAYSGLVVATNVSYTLLERTKFDVRVTRDVQYSFEETEPYYLSTDGRVTVTHQLYGAFDVTAVAGRERMAYRETGTAEINRIDFTNLVAAGFGYRLRDDLRLGVSWELTRRDSDREDRRYDRHRIVASLTYGL